MNLTALPVVLLFVVAGVALMRLQGRVHEILIARHPTTWRDLQNAILPRQAVSDFIRKRHDLRLRDPELSYAVERARAGGRAMLAAMAVLLVTYGLLLKLFAPGG